MKNRIGVVDSDARFVDRLKKGMQELYSDEFELYVFPDTGRALVAAKHIGLQVLLVDRSIAFPEEKLERPCRLVYLHSQEVDLSSTAGTPPVVCKYKSISEWHELLVTLCREVAAETEGGSAGTSGKQPKVCLFTSGGGGAGTSTAAAAFAIHLARKEKRVVYLNFETFNSTPIFFQGTGNYTMDDIMYALRSNKFEAQTLMRYALVRDNSTVRFLQPCKLPLDAFSFTGEEIVKVVGLIQNLGTVDCIILDMSADCMERLALPVIRADRVVLVSNGEPTVNLKTKQLVEALPLMCSEEKISVKQKLLRMYNRFLPEQGELYGDKDLGRLGGINMVRNRKNKDLILAMEHLPPFCRLEEELA